MTDDLIIQGGAGSTEANLAELNAKAKRLDQLAQQLGSCRRTAETARQHVVTSTWISAGSGQAASSRLDAIASGGSSVAAAAQRARALAGKLRQTARIYSGNADDVERMMAALFNNVTHNAGPLGDLAQFLLLSGRIGHEALRQWLTGQGTGTFAQFAEDYSPSLYSLIHGPLAGKLPPWFFSARLEGTLLGGLLSKDGTVTLTKKGEVIESGAATSLEQQAARISRLHPATADKKVDDPYQLEVSEMKHSDGSTSYHVFLPGMRFMGPDGHPIDLGEAILAAGTISPKISHAIDQALRASGAKKGAKVAISGHSAGGMGAFQFLNTKAAERYDIKSVATFGATLGEHRTNHKAQVMSLEHADDFIPVVEGKPNKPTPNHTTITGRGIDEKLPGNLKETMANPHHTDAYERLGRNVDSTVGDPSIETYRAEQAKVTDDVVSVKTHQFELTQNPPNQASEKSEGARTGAKGRWSKLPG